MNQQLTTTEVLEKIQEASKDYDQTELVRVPRMSIGQHFPQGDVQLERIEKPASLGRKRPGGQVVEGNTKGSRHIFEGDFQLYERKSDDPLVGPVAVLRKRSVLTHPEHRHVSLPAGTYSVSYQADHAAEERARVRD